MKFITFIKRLFRKGKKYQVWDTSAICNHFEALKNILKVQSDVTVVIPEGVSHEISVGRRNNANCKEIYKFIEGNIRNPRLILAVTPDSIRSWEIDEQVIYTAEKYSNKGYTTTLITCDRDQSFRARLKGLDTKLIPVKAPKTQEHNEQVKVTTNQKPNITAKQIGKVEAVQKMRQEEEKEFDLPARTVGKQCWIGLDKNISVYDSKGKRKIFQTDGLVISKDDVIYYKETAYSIKSMGRATITLVKMCV